MNKRDHRKAPARLLELSTYIFTKVPYFRHVGTRNFHGLPPISKIDIIDRAHDFISDDYSEQRNLIVDLMYDNKEVDRVTNFQVNAGSNIIIEQTTGTSGIPARFPKTKMERAQLAIGIWSVRKTV